MLVDYNRIMVSMISNVLGVIQASNSDECALDKRYSPSFRDQDNRQGHSSTKRKRDDVLR